jgi:DNA topoisomerase I
MKNLVIVESPTKARTISKFLGKEYEIKYSMGHIMDLPKSKIGVDFEKDFAPQLEIVEDKKQIIADLKKAAKTATTVILATDPDREGEAIAANIQELLRAKGKGQSAKFKRIVFHEITEDAIKEALTSPRDVDEHLVDAQTARRILDRLVGYQISPILWQKVRRGLSAGRVQSVALRLIVEREREIEKFKKEPYFTIHVGLRKPDGPKTPVEFEIVEINGKKIEESRTVELYNGTYKTSKTSISSETDAKKIVDEIKEKDFVVAEVLEKEMRRSPYPPYTTSTMQQDASRRYGYSGKRTMSLAQKLYEEGYITYHRTDSVTISTSAITSIRKHILSEYGEKYISPDVRVYVKKQKNAQEAHEGIRPTKIGTHLETVEKDLGRDHAKLYDMILRRAVASQMTDAITESTTVYADSADSKEQRAKSKYRVKANGSVLKFDGFLKLTPQALNDTKLPQYVALEKLETADVRADAHETPPPPRYNDASLIATLEEKGIGRPSTYASIISTIVDRAYVERIERRLTPTLVGKAVNDFLVENFSTIDDVPFTAQMEDDLDDVADGKKEWVKMMREFYKPFAKQLSEVKDAKRIKIETESTDELCPECKKHNLVIRMGRFGKFLSCDSFPECKFTKPYVESVEGLKCPKDKGNVIVKKTKKGRKFFGCSNYPNCDFAAWKLEDIKGYKPPKTEEKQDAVENSSQIANG